MTNEKWESAVLDEKSKAEKSWDGGPIYTDQIACVKNQDNFIFVGGGV